MNMETDACCQDILSCSKGVKDKNGLRIEIANDQFRILITEEIRIGWLPLTASNRKAMIVFLRLLMNKTGKPLFTYKELSAIVGSNNRQASSGHMEHFCACDKDMLASLSRRRKVDAEVVEAVRLELLQNRLLQKCSELCATVNSRLKRTDLTESNISAALDQIPYGSVHPELRNQLSNGKLHYREEYLST